MDLYGPIRLATETTISWVVETALARGCTVQFLHDSESDRAKVTQKTVRLKGKARKAAMETAKRVESSPPPKARMVSGKEIVRLAKLLQDQEEIIMVPLRVRKDMRRALLGRQFFAEKFAQNEPDNPGNPPHAHFAKTLSLVLDILTPIMDVKSAVDRSQTVKIDTAVDLSNYFQALTIDPADEGASGEANENPLMQNQAIAPILYKNEIDPLEEMRLRLMCLKVHVEEATEYVVGLWTSYFTNTGTPNDLAIVTLVTEAALARVIYLIHELEMDLGPRCPYTEIFQLLPSLQQVDLTIYAARGLPYPKRVAQLPYRIGNASEVWVEEDSFLVQLLGEMQVENVSTCHSPDLRIAAR